MTDHIIKAAIEAGVAVTVHKGKPGGPWAVSHVVTTDIERFYALAYRAGMERAAEIAEAEQDIAEEKKADQRFKDELKDLHSKKATERNAVDRGNHWMCVSTCNAVLRNAAKAIRAEAHAQNQPKNVHDGSVV